MSCVCRLLNKRIYAAADDDDDVLSVVLIKIYLSIYLLGHHRHQCGVACPVLDVAVPTSMFQT